MYISQQYVSLQYTIRPETSFFLKYDYFNKFIAIKLFLDVHDVTTYEGKKGMDVFLSTGYSSARFRISSMLYRIKLRPSEVRERPIRISGRQSE